MPDNPTLSERLRKALGNYSDTSAWLRLNGAEILQAIDDNERLTKVVSDADVCGEIGAPCPWCEARSYDANVEAVHTAACPWAALMQPPGTP